MPHALIQTAEELWASGNRHLELVHGKLVQIPSAVDAKHGRIMGRMAAKLDRYAWVGRRGEAFAGGVGFILSRSPDTVLGPDLAFVSADKLKSLNRREGFLEIAPDIVIEIISMHDSMEGIEERARQWLRFQVPLVIVIDPREKQLHVYRPDAKVTIVPEGTNLGFGGLAPGLVIDTMKLFEGKRQ